MSIGMGAAIALGLGGALPGLINTYYQYQAQQDNLKEQKKWNTYNSWLQQSIFGREDTSIQRRVADLKAAGLSPVLAAGQGAGTGGAIPISGAQSQAPQLSLDTMFAMNLMKMEADISATRAQEEYTKIQTKNAIESLPVQLENLRANSFNTNTFNVNNMGKPRIITKSFTQFGVESYEGQSIEDRCKKLVETGEPIKDNSP